MKYQPLCVECGKSSVIARGLCSTCYSRNYRKTPKGKEAQARYLAKQPPKPPKPRKVKPFCECGEMSVVKGYCRRCYYKRYRLKPPKPRKV